jgi:branched-chain amino acid transport system substrate-binding protein
MRTETRKMDGKSFLKTGILAIGLIIAVTAFPFHRLMAQPKEVKIGLLLPLTGPWAKWGQGTYYGYQLAAQICNEDGGIKSMGGAKLKVIVADYESKPDVAAVQAEQLVADKDIIMLSGSNSSAAGMLASQVCERNHICYVSAVDNEPKMLERGFKYSFLLCPKPEMYPGELIYFVSDVGKQKKLPVKKMAILNNAYGVREGDLAKKFAQEVGLEIVDYSLYEPTTQDFTGYISKYKSAGVDLLVGFHTPHDSILINRTMKELNFNPMAYGGLYGHICSKDYADTLGKDSNHVIAANHFAEDVDLPRLKEFMDRYEKQYNLPAEGLMTYGFVTLATLRAALEKHPTYDRKELQQAIEKVDIGVGPGDYNNIQIDGVKFDAKHQNIKSNVFIIEWQNGIARTLAPAKYATTKITWPRPTWDEISKGK